MNIFFKGLLIGLAISAPVGPIGILCIQRSLREGFKMGLFTGFGSALADGCYGLVAGFGLTTISSFFVSHTVLIRLVGGLFLLFLGIKMFFSHPRMQADKKRKKDKSAIQVLGTTMLLTLANPLTILLYTAIFAGLGIGSSHLYYSATLLLVMGLVVGSSLWWIFLVTVVTLVLHKRLSTVQMKSVNYFSGAVICLFGLFALLTII